MTAAQLIRQARLAAGFTQTQLATRAGVPQSTISAYEAGRRDPGFDAFSRVIAAAGYSVELGHQSRLDFVRSKRGELIDSFAQLGAHNLRVFGSVARGDDRPDSDLDLLVDLDDSVTLIGLGKLRNAAEKIVGAAVDVVPASSLKPSIRDEVDRDSVHL